MARKGALRLLQGVREGLSLADQGGALRSLPAADQARAGRLAAATLRHQGRADAVIALHVTRWPAPQIADLLRLATVEMLEFGGAAHGVVDAAVTLSRGMGKRGQAAAGMVNAVLRKVSRHEGWQALPPQRMPEWLRDSVVASWGEAVAAAIEAAHQAGAALDLTPRPGSGPLPEGQALPTGSLRLHLPGQVSALPGYSEGAWWVQDASAALPARLLDAQPGERIADLCAAPGGKTLQLASAGAAVTAIDINPARLNRLIENLARCRLAAETIVADALEWRPGRGLDAVLLDAPCSATGTIRRHPDLPFMRDGGGVADLVALQARLIDHALSLVTPGGRMVYAVCSLLTAEGEDQITAALARHPGLIVEPPDMPGIAAEWITAEGGLRLRPDFWPDLGGMDGFYMARLRMPGPKAGARV